jgi:hypothetical protein
VSTHDDEAPLEFFEEPETVESPDRPRRRMRPQRPGGPRRPSPPPAGAVALARLAGFVALAIAVVVGLVFWVGSCQGQSTHDEYKSYMDKIQPIAQSSAAAGGTAALAKTFGSQKLTLDQLHSKLEQWSLQQQQDYNAALRLRPPAALQAAHQQVLATLQLRAIGLTNLANTLAEAGSKPSAKVADLLVTQARLLSASDLVWTELFKLPATQAMTRAGVRGVIAPPSEMITNAEVITPRSFDVVYSRLNATNSTTGKVTGLHGSELVSTSAVAGSSVKQLSPSGQNNVQVSSNLVLRVAFKNAGNFQEVNVPVTLTVTAVSQKPVVTQKKHVSSVEAGHTATVDFGNLSLPTQAFGANATIQVEVGKVPGEQNLDNNKATYAVFFSLPSNP